MADLECDGYGCVPADFMFVGISAGRLGALITKVPFTKDASGRIFQRCLKELGFSKTNESSLQPELINCYVTNLVKSRCLTDKGLNRLPTTKEVYLWFPYFEKECNKVKPRLILCLGDFVHQKILRYKHPFTAMDKAGIRCLKHPRWYQSHGALNANSSAFAKMTQEYRQQIFGE